MKTVLAADELEGVKRTKLLSSSMSLRGASADQRSDAVS